MNTAQHYVLDYQGKNATLVSHDLSEDQRVAEKMKTQNGPLYKFKDESQLRLTCHRGFFRKLEEMR
jgi:hypothetical protein